MGAAAQVNSPASGATAQRNEPRPISSGPNLSSARDYDLNLETLPPIDSLTLAAPSASLNTDFGGHTEPLAKIGPEFKPSVEVIDRSYLRMTDVLNQPKSQVTTVDGTDLAVGINADETNRGRSLVTLWRLPVNGNQGPEAALLVRGHINGLTVSEDGAVSFKVGPITREKQGYFPIEHVSTREDAVSVSNQLPFSSQGLPTKSAA